MTINKFLETYSRLLVCDVQQRLGRVAGSVEIRDADARFLMQMASALAFGPPDPDEVRAGQWKAWAYDAATRLAVGRGIADGRYIRAAEMILARLGNFPGRQYLHDTYGNGQNGDRLPPVLAVEALTHEAENTIEFQGLSGCE